MANYYFAPGIRQLAVPLQFGSSIRVTAWLSSTYCNRPRKTIRDKFSMRSVSSTHRSVREKPDLGRAIINTENVHTLVVLRQPRQVGGLPRTSPLPLAMARCNWFDMRQKWGITSKNQLQRSSSLFKSEVNSSPRSGKRILNIHAARLITLRPRAKSSGTIA